MRNIGTIISTHNKNQLFPKRNDFVCNCRIQSEYPLDGKCLTPKIIYRADITNLSTMRKYFILGKLRRLLRKDTTTIKGMSETKNIKIAPS